MKKSAGLLCIGLAAAFAICGAAACKSSDPFEEVSVVENLEDAERVNLYGRTMRKRNTNADAQMFPNSASGFEVRIRGTKLTASARAVAGTSENKACQFSVFIDGDTDSDAHVVTIKQNALGYFSVTLAEGLSEGEHTLRVLKRTDSLCNTAYFSKLETDGTFLRAPKRTAKTIEVFGDSITCGYGVMREYHQTETGTVVDSKDYRGETQNVFRSYAGVAAADLGTDLNVYGRSGIPLYFKRPNETYSVANNPSSIAVDLDAKDYPYDYSSFTPDAVVIYLGTNDFIRRDNGGFTPAGMEVELARFLRDVIGANYGKDIPIAICSGMMMKEASGLDAVMKNVQQSLVSEFPNLIHVEFADTIMGVGAHPVLEESAAAGHLLAEKLAPLLGITL